MKAGLLNNRVTLRQMQSGQDAVGQMVRTWTDIATVWADVRQVSGLEQIRADANVSIVRVSVRIRYKTGITAGMRVAQGTNVYEIKAVLMDEQGKEFTDLACELVV